jgi:hypothetical protein
MPPTPVRDRQRTKPGPGGHANTYDYYNLFGRQLFVAFTAKFL